MPLSHYFCSRQQQTPPGETEIWGRSEEARFPVGCAKWQLFKLKVTAGWIGLIYCQCQSSLTPFCVRACQRPGSDLFTSLHWLKGNQETVRGGTYPIPGPKGLMVSWGDWTQLAYNCGSHRDLPAPSWEKERRLGFPLGKWIETVTSYHVIFRV